MHTTLAPTLSDRLFPQTSRLLRDLVLIVSGSLLMAVFARIRIPLPFTPVPITGQTLGVLLVGATLGSRRGLLSLTLYLGLGVVGLPIFAGGAQGLTYLAGPTGGYLIGFVVAAYVVGLLAEQGLERDLRTALLPFLIGEMIIYLFGVTWLAIVIGNLGKALAMGFLPFLAVDSLKMVLAAALLPAAWKLAK